MTDSSAISILNLHPPIAPLPEGWNVLATAKDHEQHRLAKRLCRFGDFRWTAYRGLLAGRVEDHEAFFAQLMRCEDAEPGFLDPVARILPITHTFAFRPETLLTQLQDTIRPWAGQIDGHPFHVRCERRGHAGMLHSQAVERTLHERLREWLTAQGHHPVITFRDPEFVIAVELIDTACGIAMLSKSLWTRFPFVRIP